MKLIVLGSSKVGKTSLLSLLKKEKINEDSYHDFYLNDFHIEVWNRFYDKNEVIDFSRVECLCLLYSCLNKKQCNDVYDYYKAIRKDNPNLPILIIGTHIDQSIKLNETCYQNFLMNDPYCKSCLINNKDPFFREVFYSRMRELFYVYETY